MFQAVLSNPDHPDYGVVTIPFPIPHDQYAHCMELLAALEIGDAVKADCKVEKVDSFYTVLKRVEMLTVNVEELNYLAKRLDSFDTGEAAQFQAMAHKLLEHLGGKELTSAGHLSAQNFSFSDEVMMENGKLNFYVQADFDVDAAFGTFVCTDENDDWLNIYANYDIMRDRPCDTLELNLCKGDGTEENWSYHLNAAEQEVLARKMEAFCQQQNGMSLRDFARQLQEEPAPSQQIQM